MNFLKSLNEARTHLDPPSGFEPAFFQKLFKIFEDSPDQKHSAKFPAKKGWRFAKLKEGHDVAIPEGRWGKAQFITGFYYNAEEVYFQIGTRRGGISYMHGGKKDFKMSSGRSLTRTGITEKTFQNAKITQYKVLNIF